VTKPTTDQALTDQALIARALAARQRAYAPYSRYLVGSAVEVVGGDVFEGSNVENASYGLAICAERSAITAAVNAGHRQIARIAVATESSPPAAPCGVCLQTINEFSADPAAVRVILANPDGQTREFSLAQLFPHGFRGEQLPRK
jgi:cytidine deaminase